MLRSRRSVRREPPHCRSLARKGSEFKRRHTGRIEFPQIDIACTCHPYELYPLFFFHLLVVHPQGRSVGRELHQADPGGLDGHLYSLRELGVVRVLFDGFPEMAAGQAVDVPVRVNVTAKVEIARLGRRDHLPLFDGRMLRIRSFLALRACRRGGLFLPFRRQTPAADVGLLEL